MPRGHARTAMPSVGWMGNYRGGEELADAGWMDAAF